MLRGRYDHVLHVYRELLRLDFERTTDSQRSWFVPFNEQARAGFFDWKDEWEYLVAKEMNQGIATMMTKLVSYVPRL